MLRKFNDDIRIQHTKSEDSDNKNPHNKCIFVLNLFEENTLYHLVLYSVQFPGKTYIINCENTNEWRILAKDFLHDILSPMCFLHEDNSMGRIKNMKDQDSAFGEAIIEVRAISSVNSWFLNLYNITDSDNKNHFFLKYTYNDLPNEAVQLFRFLKNFKISETEIQKRILEVLTRIKEFKNG